MSNARTAIGTRVAPLMMILAVIMTGSALALLIVHIHRTQALKSQYLALAEELPALRTRIRLKEVHIDAERVIGADAKARLEEQASTLVLPARIDSAHIVQSLTDTAVAVRSEGFPLTVASVTPEAPVAGMRTVTMRATGSFSAVARMLAVLKYGGYLTIGDVLGDRTKEFLTVLEEQAPLALPSAEEFLRQDILTYAAEPDIVEQGFLANVPQTLAPDMRALVLDAGLSDVRLSLTPVAKRLQERRLWPLPFTALTSVVMEGENVVMQFSFPEQPKDEK